MHVSHETIHTTIYAHPKGELCKDLIACLRQGRSARKSRSAGEDRRGQIPEIAKHWAGAARSRPSASWSKPEPKRLRPQST